MKYSPKCSLIISTYNWPEALDLVLQSVLRQSVLPDEVIIADDGSTNQTEVLINNFQKTFPIPIKHIWQEDNGNQKAMIMNKAIAQASYEYIVEVDGDIIMHKHFIKDHLKFAEANYYLFGSRVTLKKSHLHKIYHNKQITFNYFSKGIKKRGRTIHFPFLTKFFKPVDQRSSKFRGCNVSFWKEDFIKVNGYNEAFKGWGREDSELIERMHNNGIKGKRLKFAGLAYHLYHLEQSKNRLKNNDLIEQQTIANKVIRTIDGIDKYL
ncbi:glycosyltransferase family 2 protein [Aquimarina sp. 2-A2]|uniref:glycosyltransferase family 2 protein n=1 Tax=Aquimarina sp. 2-A2 TaxID=3382644 RepID=UPI00387F348F